MYLSDGDIYCFCFWQPTYISDKENCSLAQKPSDICFHKKREQQLNEITFGLLLNVPLEHIVGLTRICRFSPRIQQFSSRFRRELLNSLRESSNSRHDENCFSPLTTRIAQFSVTLERMRELLFSDEQRRQ